MAQHQNGGNRSHAVRHGPADAFSFGCGHADRCNVDQPVIGGWGPATSSSWLTAALLLDPVPYCFRGCARLGRGYWFWRLHAVTRKSARSFRDFLFAEDETLIERERKVILACYRLEFDGKPHRLV